MEPQGSAISFRRVSWPRRFFRLREGRRYEVHRQGDEPVIVKLHVLDRLLDARHFPADFWACVGAADAAYKRGDLDVVIVWSSGVEGRL